MLLLFHEWPAFQGFMLNWCQRLTKQWGKFKYAKYNKKWLNALSKIL